MEKLLQSGIVRWQNLGGWSELKQRLKGAFTMQNVWVGFLILLCSSLLKEEFTYCSFLWFKCIYPV